MLRKAYGDQVLSRTTVYEWLKRFKEGRESPRKVRLQKSKIKMMLITFFDSEGMIHKDFVPEGSMVIGQYYLGSFTTMLRLKSASPCASFWHQNRSKYFTILRTHQICYRVTTFCSPNSKCS